MWCMICGVFFFKQKTAYEMRISDWSSDVCSSDLPRLRSLWLERVGLHGEGLGERMGPILRYGVASLLLALAANMWLWHDHAALILGAVLGTTTAMLVTHVLRGLHIPRWVSLPVALVVLIAIVSNRAGGLIPLTDALERVGFNVGNTRFSLLSMLTLSVTVVALFAGIRLANRITEHSIAGVRDFNPDQKLTAQKLAALERIVEPFSM